MISSRPYIIRALYEWILDNKCTPHVLVNANEDGVEVPRQYVRDGQIVLNISPSAVAGLLIDNEGIHFNGRFGGVPKDVHVPISGVQGIYARENGQGMVFDSEDEPPPEPPRPSKPAPPGPGGRRRRPGGKRPNLTIVK